jgi:uncharacterized protein
VAARGTRRGCYVARRITGASGASVSQAMVGGRIMSTAGMKELVTYVARALVDSPDAVEVREVAGDQTAVIELRVAKEDLGKVIGKQGRTARAMRTLLSAAATKGRKRAVLEILE